MTEKVHSVHFDKTGNAKNKWLALGILGVLIFFLALNALPAWWQSLQPQPSVHLHANFLMVMNGKEKDFSLDSFQSPVSCGINEPTEEVQVHLHQNNGGVIHVHEKNITYADFFASEKLGMQLSDHCFWDENGSQWCDTEKDRWKFYVNGVETPNLPDTVIQDEDVVLLLYGYYTPSQIGYYDKKVPHDACEYSHTCPTTNPLTEDNCST